MALYSICITCRDNVLTVKASLDSILNQINNLFELIVVDSKSRDGTIEILEEYADNRLIRLIVDRCSRGRGRQIAFENAKGEYVIANMDLDDVFMPKLTGLLDFYHKYCEAKVLLAVNGVGRESRGLQNITIGEKNLIEELGGWRDLQWAEDWDLWSRASEGRCYRWTIFPMIEEVGLHPERKRILTRFVFRCVKYRELMRLGRHVFYPTEKIYTGQRLAFLLAKIAILLKESYRDPLDRTFNPYDKKYFANPV